MLNVTQLDLLSNLLYISNNLFEESKLKDAMDKYKEKSVEEIKDLLITEFINDTNKEDEYKEFIEKLNFKFNDCLLTRNIRDASNVIGDRFLLYPEIKNEILKLLENGLNENSLKDFELLVMNKTLNDMYIDMFFQGILERLLFWGIMNSKR